VQEHSALLGSGFASQQEQRLAYEGLQMSDCILHKKHVKKALRKNSFPDSFTLSRYSFSPYMACSHGCAYCDGRAEKYYVEGDFDRDIIVRDNIDQLLLKELSNVREKGPVSISSGVTDAYQPVEELTGLTRKCLEVLSYFDLPVTLLTKSVLIERDLDILSKIALANSVTVFISLVHIDDETRRIFEPKAASVEERLSLIGKLRNAGCSVGVLAMPMIPLLADSKEYMETLFDRVLEAGAQFIIPGSLTLRPGRQKDFFLQRIQEYYPLSLESYRDLYSNNLQSGSPLKSYTDRIYSQIGEITRCKGINTMVPHHIYRRSLHKSDELYILLNQLKESYGYRGVDTRRLSTSLASYVSFLEKEKKELGRNIASNTEYLNKLIPDLCRSGKIDTILKNSRLSSFVKTLYLEDKLFDFTTMKIC
jgi:DNA repair photolyase